MAFYDEEDDQNGGGQEQQGPTNASSSVVNAQGAGGMSQGPQAPKAAPASSKGPSRSSNFVGINEYLKANKPQTQKLANTLGTYATKDAEAAKTQVQGAEANFNQQAEQNTVGFNQDLANQIRNDPTKVNQDSNLQAQARRMGNVYAGPTNLADTDQFKAAQTAAQKGLEKANKLGGENTQRELLEGIQKDTRQGRVSRGASVLDQGLLATDPNAKKTLQGFKDQVTSTVPKALEESLQRGLTKGTQAKATTDATNQAYNDLFYGNQGVITSKNQELAQRAQQANTQAGKVRDHNQAILNEFLNGQDVSEEGLSFLGLNRGQVDELRGLARQYAPAQGLTGDKLGVLGNYANLKASGPQATSANVANADDLARLDALYSLSGGKNTIDRSQVGKFQQANPDMLDFDYGGALKYLQGLKPAPTQPQGPDWGQILQNPRPEEITKRVGF